MGGHLNLFSRRQKSTKQGKSAFENIIQGAVVSVTEVNLARVPRALEGEVGGG
jgi:hypothetical protein